MSSILHSKETHSQLASRPPQSGYNSRTLTIPSFNEPEPIYQFAIVTFNKVGRLSAFKMNGEFNPLELSCISYYIVCEIFPLVMSMRFK